MTIGQEYELTDCTFDNKGIKYLFSWPEIELQAEVSRVVMNHNSAKALVVFTSSNAECNPHILQTRLNLESTRSRNELAKDLAMRYPLYKGVDWKGICEYLCVKTVREYEKGEPIILITSEDEITPLEYLLHPLIPLYKPTVFFGDPGAGKSQLAVILLIAAMLPWTNNPIHLGVLPKSQVGLFLDYEADPDDVRRQVVALTRGMKLPYVELHYRRCAMPIAEDLESIRQHLDDIGATFILVDSTSLAAGNDLNRMDVASSYFRAIRSLHITSLSLAHTSKSLDARTKTILGSVLWEAGARSVWEVKGQEDDDILDIALFHRKANLSRKFPPQGYRLTYKDDLPVDVRWHNPKDVAEFVERMSTNDRILDALKGGAMTMDALVEQLEIPRNNARVAVHRLQKKGMLVHLPDGSLGLQGGLEE